jgi:hypothetical protein
VTDRRRCYDGVSCDGHRPSEADDPAVTRLTGGTSVSWANMSRTTLFHSTPYSGQYCTRPHRLRCTSICMIYTWSYTWSCLPAPCHLRMAQRAALPRFKASPRRSPTRVVLVHICFSLSTSLDEQTPNMESSGYHCTSFLFS